MLHRSKTASIAAFAAGLSILAPACTPGPAAPANIGPSKGAIIAAAVGVVAGVAVITTVVVVEVHEHHTVKGCLVNGPNGMQIQETQDPKAVYSLQGAPVDLKVGDLVRLHGDRGPKVKKGDVRTFQVKEIKKNYGACPAPSPMPSH